MPCRSRYMYCRTMWRAHLGVVVRAESNQEREKRAGSNRGLACGVVCCELPADDRQLSGWLQTASSGRSLYGRSLRNTRTGDISTILTHAAGSRRLCHS
jgi:hypothetical protein